MRFIVICVWVAALLAGGYVLFDMTRTGHEIVTDDYAAALAKARLENKRLLVNFTAYT